VKRTAFEVVADAIRYVARLRYPPVAEIPVTIKEIALAADRSEARVKEVLDHDYGAIGLRIGAEVVYNDVDMVVVRGLKREPGTIDLMEALNASLRTGDTKPAS
jgi:hypothetical protein